MTNWPDTHWTRILHYDLFAGEAATSAPQATEASGNNGHAFALKLPGTSRSVENATSAPPERVPLMAAAGYPLVSIHASPTEDDPMPPPDSAPAREP